MSDVSLANCTMKKAEIHDRENYCAHSVFLKGGRIHTATDNVNSHNFLTQILFHIDFNRKPLVVYLDKTAFWYLCVSQLTRKSERESRVLIFFPP